MSDIEQSGQAFIQLASTSDVKHFARKKALASLGKRVAFDCALAVGASLLLLAAVGTAASWTVIFPIAMVAIVSFAVRGSQDYVQLHPEFVLTREISNVTVVVSSREFSPAATAVAVWALNHPHATPSSLLRWPELHELATARWGSMQVELAERVATSHTTVAGALNTATASLR